MTNNSEAKLAAEEQSSARLRVAIYARFSSEMQNEISIDDQVQRCREEIARRGWRVAGIYSDSARSGWSLDRQGFQDLRVAAEKGKFDAVMMWKFDRLARDHNHTVMIKALLRHQYGLKLFCVEGVSSDDDDSPYTTLVEQMIAVFASFYSQNLSSDAKRAKRGRVMRGEYNGSVAPLGYILVTNGQATPERPAGLYADEEVAPLIVEAFRRYASGEYSDRTLAEWLNEQPIIQKRREGQKPVGKAMVRDLIRNRTYTGRVGYAETIYAGSLGQRRASPRKRREWFEGKHEAIVSDELFEACQQVRKKLAKVRKTKQQRRSYVLSGRVYCAQCLADHHEQMADPNYGKMRGAWHNRDGVGYFRCVARDRGYGDCSQRYVPEDTIVEQLVEVLSTISLPGGALERIDEAVRLRRENEDALTQLQELEDQQHRVQFSWEQGHLAPEDYLEKMSRLEREIASMRPLDYDKLEEAADLVTHFRHYWDQCAQLTEPKEAQQQLMAKIIDRAFIYDDRLIAVALHPNFGIVLNVPESAPDQIIDVVSQNKKGYNPSELYPERERRDSNPRSSA